MTKLYIYTVFLLFPSSVIHRLLAYKYLSGRGVENPFDPVKNILVGVASDFWIANFLALIVVILGVLLFLAGAKFLAARLAFALGIVSMLTLILHQSYVEFFGYQITPFHLQYLNDPGAAAGNFTSLLTWKTAAILWPLFLLRPTKFLPNFRFIWYLPIILFLVATSLHAWNIRYRVQWFVPDNLRNHWIENLYYQSLRAKLPISVTRNELTSHLNWNFIPDSNEPSSYGRELYKSQPPKSVGLFFDAIKSELQKTDGPPRFVFIVLLESARAVDSGLWQKNNSTSLTPNIDQLGRSGLWYSRAFSTGNVTRGAQEAVFCGYLSSQNTSMMRIRSDLKLPCLNNWSDSSTDKKVRLGWYHGGRGEFDAQESFWRAHGTRIGATQKNFDDSTPSTSWGVSDLSLYRYAVADLVKTKTLGTLHISFILSITNHIPWKLPSDAPHQIKSLSSEAAPSSSHTTLAYSDWALGRFVDLLKAEGIWEKSLLVVLGDHGHLETPLSTYNGIASKGKMLSHIPLVLNGGIVEKARRIVTVSEFPVEYPKWTSQVDVSSLLNWLGDTNIPNMGHFGADKDRPVGNPVVSDFGNEIYLPEHDFLMSENMFLEKPTDQLPPQLKPGVIYYRAFLQWINSGGQR